MPLTRSEAATLRSIERDAMKLARHAKRVAEKAKSRLIKEMRKS